MRLATSRNVDRTFDTIFDTAQNCERNFPRATIEKFRVSVYKVNNSANRHLARETSTTFGQCQVVGARGRYRAKGDYQ